MTGVLSGQVVEGCLAEKGGRGVRHRRGYHSAAATTQYLGQRLHEASCTFSSGQWALYCDRCPYVIRICKQKDTAGGGGALDSRAPPALLCTLPSARRGRRRPVSSAAEVDRCPLGPCVDALCAVELRTCAVLQAGTTGSPDSGRSFLHAALAEGTSDAPRAPSFPRKKSLTRTTY
jgi:hypothetical protein